MELFTMNSEYDQEEPIDFFSSVIWTERKSGDGDFQITVPAQPSIIRLLSIGTRVGCVDSPEVMMVDKQTMKDGGLTVVGRSLTQNLNSRFLFKTENNTSQSYSVDGEWSMGFVMKNLVDWWAIRIASDGFTPYQTGIPNAERLRIPDLTIDSYDDTGPTYYQLAIPFGPLFDTLKNLADTYGLCQRIERHGVADIRYRNWRGLDRTTDSENPVIRFSVGEDNFSGTTEVVDGTNFKTDAFAFDANSLDFLSGPPGEDTVEGDYTGFDLRAELVLVTDIGSRSGYVPATLLNVLQLRAAEALAQAPIVAGIDGTILPNAKYVYGKDYNLGDIVETQGSSGIVQKSQVTEFIRSQDATGEKAYPTLIAV